MKGRARALVADSGPVTVLAVIAAVGSFDHISHLAATYGQHGWRSWAVAVCIDLVCVMAAREIQRDKRTGRRRHGLLSWPSLVLTGGIVLTLAANLAEAPRTSWGWILAATPAGAFLIAMSMIERRAGHSTAAPAEQASPRCEEPTLPASEAHAVTHVDIDRLGQAPDLVPEASTPALEQATRPPAESREDGQPSPPPVLLAYARRLAGEHRSAHGRPITADVLRMRMNVTPELAAVLARHADSHE
ncbi:hypothetical protein GCM10022419_045380 [Nonomuraea rosea]|uniref:DUF2637 domain-containing protein n=1 Tax=Nonomuraea rosea TaxID=638574 RepID=A0ABP6X6G3_9ACTN